MVSLYLIDGTLITVDAENVNSLVGSFARDENGPLKPGRYILADRELLTVGKQGKVTGLEYDPAAALLI